MINELIGIAKSKLGDRGLLYNTWYGWVGWQPWCCAFVSWCAETLTKDFAKYTGKYAYVPSMIKHYQDMGEYYDNSCSPDVGDFVVFDWDNDGIADHIGIVSEVYPSYIITIEGNVTGLNDNIDMVRECKRNRVNGGILGYLNNMKYFNGEVVMNQEQAQDKTSGWISSIVTGNWRIKPSINSEVMATYPEGSRIEVIGYEIGDDPYNTGQYKWYKSKIHGWYSWEGIYAEDVDKFARL